MKRDSLFTHFQFFLNLEIIVYNSLKVQTKVTPGCATVVFFTSNSVEFPTRVFTQNVRCLFRSFMKAISSSYPHFINDTKTPENPTLKSYSTRYKITARIMINVCTN